MQAEHDAALQSLTAAETLSSGLLLASGDSQAGAAQQEQSNGVKQKVSSTMQQQDTEPGDRNLQIDAVRGLAVKAALAKASILKQLKRTDEANECMQTAKNLDPAVGKYVKD